MHKLVNGERIELSPEEEAAFLHEQEVAAAKQKENEEAHQAELEQLNSECQQILMKLGITADEFEKLMKLCFMT